MNPAAILHNSRLPVLLVAILLANGCTPSPDPGSLLIEGARIVDGSGSPAYTADLRISSGRIAEIGSLDPRDGEAVLAANGRVLAPGFIDTHSHADDDLAGEPTALAAVSQGITTVVVGQDGGSPFPLTGFVAALEQHGSAVNVASYAGHNTLRDEVMGKDFARAATPEEVAAMRTLLEQELAAGALGLSTGLEYDPGIYSDRAEVIALAQAAAAAGGRYISHIRSEDRWFFDALDEIIDIGRVTGMPVQVSHIKLAMKSLWNRADEAIAKLDAARRDGVDISADIYPYEFWQSNMMVLLPERDPSDRAAVAYALSEIAPPDGMWFTRYEPEPSYVGKTLTEVAGLRETDPVTAFMELAQQSIAYAERTGEGADSIIGTSMTAADIETLLAWEHTNVCTDGGLVDLHPRAFGAFPRVLSRYVRERKVLSLETAIHKMSGLSAEHMGFGDRGRIAPGLVADLVLLDPDQVLDRATPERPQVTAAGIDTVWVAGVAVFENGAATGALPGRFIVRPGKR